MPRARAGAGLPARSGEALLDEALTGPLRPFEGGVCLGFVDKMKFDPAENSMEQKGLRRRDDSPGHGKTSDCKRVFACARGGQAGATSLRNSGRPFACRLSGRSETRDPPRDTHAKKACSRPTAWLSNRAEPDFLHVTCSRRRQLPTTQRTVHFDDQRRFDILSFICILRAWK